MAEEQKSKEPAEAGEQAEAKEAVASEQAVSQKEISVIKETEEQRNETLASLKIKSELSSAPKLSLGGDLSPSSQDKNRMLDVVLGREDTDVARLLELLENLLEKNEGNSNQHKEVVNKLQRTIQRMLEEGPYSQMAVIGKTGMFKAGQFGNLAEDDKRSLEKNEALEGDLAKRLDIAKALPPKPTLERELQDHHAASAISFKFVAFKTANSWNQSI